MVRFRSGEQPRQISHAPPNNGECSLMVKPHAVTVSDASSNLVIHPKLCAGSSVVERKVEALGVGGSIPSQRTNLRLGS